MQPIEQFCCQNKECKDYGIRGKGNLRFRGWSGIGKRIRMIFCCTCEESFSERKGTVLEQSRLSKEKAISILDHIREGCGTRSTSRLVGVDKNTVTHRSVQMFERCSSQRDQPFQGEKKFLLHINILQQCHFQRH